MKRPEPDCARCTINTVTHTLENDLLDRRDFFLSDQNFDAFKKMLNTPPKEIQVLKALFREKAPWER
ncbi:MAG: DUF1778 domain-containing protein [Proteobacteria bacterium]|nr:DUF1778 domain-containing protein [Pseudomonadota bacterium]